MKKQEVTLSNIQIIAALDGLAALRQKELPVSIGFSIVDNLKAIRRRVESYNEFRQEIIKKYATLDEQGNPVVLPSGVYSFPSKEAERTAERDIVALNSATVEESFTVYSRQEFMAAGVSIAPGVLEVLDWMICE